MFVGFRTHLQNQMAALDHVGVVQAGLVQRMAVECGGLDINIGRGVPPGFDGEVPAGIIRRIQVENHPVEQRAGEIVVRPDGAPMNTSTWSTGCGTAAKARGTPSNEQTRTKIQIFICRAAMRRCWDDA